MQLEKFNTHLLTTVTMATKSVNIADILGLS